LALNSNLLYQLFKYAVYALLSLNIFLFFSEEMTAALLQFPNGVAAIDMIEAYSATIDTAAWVVLLLMFELETYVLEDRHFTPGVTWTLHGLRALCYTFIVYAFYGYIANLTFLTDVTVMPGISDVCALAGDSWSWAATLDEYVSITAANCASFSTADVFYQFPGMPAVVDAQGLVDIRRLAWVDVINAAVWLLVVVVLEVDVRLQEHNRLEGMALRISSATKIVLYSLLFLAAVYWGLKGDFVDFWDAFLWLVAFVFIEMNVFEWRQEEHAASDPQTQGSP
jgi:hypothetical protein